MKDAKSNRENIIRTAKINLILDAALKLFSEKGFHNTRLEDIARDAGFSKASLYTYYKDKETIFLRLAIRVFSELIETLHERIDEKKSFSLNLELLLKTIFSTLGDHASIFLTITNFMAINILNKMSLYEEHQEDVTALKALYDDIIETFSIIIAKGRKKREFKSTLDNLTLTKMLGSLIRGKLFEWKLSGKIDDVDKAIEEIMQFSSNGFGFAKN